MNEICFAIENASKSIDLSIPQNYYVCWYITTQASFEIEFTIKDEIKTYYNGKRKSINPLPVIAGMDKVIGNKTVLMIDIPQSRRIDARMSIMEVQGSNGVLLARTITILGEGGSDYDYNDLIVNITAWRTEG